MTTLAYRCDGQLRVIRNEAGEIRSTPELSACQLDATHCAFDPDGNHIGDFCDTHLAAGIQINVYGAGGEDGQGEDVTVRRFTPVGHEGES